MWDVAGLGASCSAEAFVGPDLLPFAPAVLGWQSCKSSARVGNWQARPRRVGRDHPHAIAAKEDLLLGPLGGHAPLDRRRRQVELVVQRLLDEVQQRALDGAEDHLLEVCVAQQSM